MKYLWATEYRRYGQVVLYKQLLVVQNLNNRCRNKLVRSRVMEYVHGFHYYYMYIINAVKKLLITVETVMIA